MQGNFPTTSSKPIVFSSKTQEVYAEGWALVSKMKVYAMLGRRGELEEEVRRYFKVAVKYQFNRLASEMSGFLQYYYLFIRGDKYRGEKYSQLRAKYDELSSAEKYVERIYAQMAYKINNSRNLSATLQTELDNTCNDLRSYLKYNSTQIKLYIYGLLNIRAYLLNDHATIIRNSRSLIEYLEAHKIEKTTNARKDLAFSLICLGRYEEASTSIQQAIARINKGSLSWSIYIYYRFVLKIHQEDYDGAYQLYKEAEKKKQINKAMMEQWLITRGYVKFLVQGQLVKGTTHFKLGKFLNEVPIFSKDKEGNNIHILILKIILNLGLNHDKIIDERDAIERYIERYLKTNHLRSKLFLQMLLQIPLSHFNRSTLAFRTKNLLKRLEKARTLKGFDPDREIVPFERLWGMVLELL
ncbi:MAG: hypothetical protein AAF985_25300 [Bacteroidota bacterium]